MHIDVGYSVHVCCFISDLPAERSTSSVYRLAELIRLPSVQPFVFYFPPSRPPTARPLSRSADHRELRRPVFSSGRSSQSRDAPRLQWRDALGFGARGARTKAPRLRRRRRQMGEEWEGYPLSVPISTRSSVGSRVRRPKKKTIFTASRKASFASGVYMLRQIRTDGHRQFSVPHVTRN